MKQSHTRARNSIVTQNMDIIFIDLVGAGKSTQAKLIAKAHSSQLVSLGSIVDIYNDANGFGKSQFRKAVREKGFLDAYRPYRAQC